MRLIILGAPGSGKTTLGLLLLKSGLPVIDADVLYNLGSWVDLTTGLPAEFSEEAVNARSIHFVWDPIVLYEFLMTHNDCLVLGIANNAYDMAYLFDAVAVISPDLSVVTEEFVSKALAERKNRYNPWEKGITQWSLDTQDYVNWIRKTFVCHTFVQRYDGQLARFVERHFNSLKRNDAYLKTASWYLESLLYRTFSQLTPSNRKRLTNLQEVKRTNPMKDAHYKALADKGDKDYRLAWIISEMNEYLQVCNAEEQQPQELLKLEALDFLLLPAYAFQGDYDCLDGRFIKSVLSDADFTEIREVCAAVANSAEVLHGGYESWNAKNVAKGRESRDWETVSNDVWLAASAFNTALAV